MKNYNILLFTFLCVGINQINAQFFEIEGEAKIMSMDVQNNCDSIVVRTADGTLALREAFTLAGGGASFQNLSINGTNDTIFLTNGGFVKLPESSGGGTIQTISINRDLDTIFLSDGGGFVELPVSGGSPQTISLSPTNDTIFLSDGGFVELPPDAINDADSDARNELQTLSSQGDTLFIVNGNDSSFVVLPGLQNLQYLNISIQERLNRGATPLDIYRMGFPLDSLYGRIYKGGHIFYLDTQDTLTGLSGMVAAPHDISIMSDEHHPWGCPSSDPIPFVEFFPSGPGADIGQGAANTTTIAGDACSTSNDAADLCEDYSDQNLLDWFLPSVLELEAMYNQIGLGAPAANSNLGSFANERYWSSTVSDDNGTYSIDFSNGNISGLIRTDQVRVRAVRSFE